MDRLRDPVWQSIAVILPLLVLLTSFLLSKLLFPQPLSQTPNRLMINVQTRTEIANLKGPVGNRAKVLIDNKEEKELRLFIFRVEYKGNEPIRSTDFEIPLRARIPDSRKLISIQEAKVDPPAKWVDGRRVSSEHLPIQVEFEILDPHSFQIKPRLMNPGDWMAFEVYTASMEGAAKRNETELDVYDEVRFSCHIAGVQCPGKVDWAQDFPLWNLEGPAFLNVYVNHIGWAVYSIVGFAILDLLILVLLSLRAGLDRLRMPLKILLFAIGIALSMASAEVLTDWIFPSILGIDEEQPIYAWVFVWTNVTGIVALLVMAIWRSNRQQRKRSSRLQEES